MSDSGRTLAMDAGLIAVGTGLSFLLPGSGPIAVRLGQHIVDRLLRNRVVRLEDFHRRVFASDVAEHEVNERFKAMDDGDFQHLLAAMLGDIEAEKVLIYSAAYIFLVEDKTLSKGAKRKWVTAVSTLRLHDLEALRDLVREKGTALEDDSGQRLRLVGAVAQIQEPDEQLNDQGDFEDAPYLGPVQIEATDFGRELVMRLDRAIEEASEAFRRNS